MELNPICLECKYYKKGDICEKKTTIDIRIKTGEIECKDKKDITQYKKRTE